MRTDPRIAPLEDPTPFTPTVKEIDTSTLPPYAKTAEEWWLIVNTIWPAILDILGRVDMVASKERAEKMRAAKEPALSELLDKAWAAAPDAYFIHTWPQWDRFCDLCSECHVLFPDQDEG